MKKVCFVPIDDRFYYPEGAHIMINSFKRFHPDIDLVVFRQDTIDKLFKDKQINWFNAKPYFAELLEDKYDLIVNMDADHIVLDRMAEVFDKTDYEVGLPWNFNDYENSAFENITEEMYLQAGMVASTSREFWAEWRRANRNADQYIRRENDIVNLVVYNTLKPKLKIFDRDKDYYGCKALGREPEFYIDHRNRTMCRKEQVIAYHYARGGQFPKLDIANMPLIDEVKTSWLDIAMYGNTVKII